MGFQKVQYLPLANFASIYLFLDHIAKGHWLVIIHADSSVFYDWPEFQNLACGTWKDGTNHGDIHINRVDFTAEPHCHGRSPPPDRGKRFKRRKSAPSKCPCGGFHLAARRLGQTRRGCGQRESNPVGPREVIHPTACHGDPDSTPKSAVAAGALRNRRFSAKFRPPPKKITRRSIFHVGFPGRITILWVWGRIV